MERLTFDGNFCDIAQCTETRGGSFCEDGSCSQHKVWERLKEYESAGLTPREVHAYSDAEQNKRVVIFENQETLGRVADLICAEEQGRLVVTNGVWVESEFTYHGGKLFSCSRCDKSEVIADMNSKNYCPNCGAKMEDTP